MSEYWSAGPGLPALGHPWLRGDGLFETLKTVKGIPYFLDRHLARLSRSAMALLFSVPDLNLISSKVREVAGSSGWNMGRLRLTYFSHGEFLISHEELVIDDAKEFSLGISPHRRYASDFISQHKTLSYTVAAFGLRVAAQSGHDDLLYLNETGEVVETGLANILVEIDGKLLTPRMASGILPGIVRGILLEWFSQIEEARLLIDDLKSASGLYLLSSIRELQLISTLDTGEERLSYRESEAVKTMRQSYLDRSQTLANS
jgi:branched-chain amino acid aminotransferase